MKCLILLSVLVAAALAAPVEEQVIAEPIPDVSETIQREEMPALTGREMDLAPKPVLVKDQPVEPVLAGDRPIEPVLVEDRPIEPVLVEDRPAEPVLVEDRPIEPVLIKEPPLEPVLIKEPVLVMEPAAAPPRVELEVLEPLNMEAFILFSGYADLEPGEKY